MSRDFPCRFTHYNFANRLRDKINEAVYCNRILRGSPEMPSGELVGTTLKLTTGREVTDGHSHFPTSCRSYQPRSPPDHCYLLPLLVVITYCQRHLSIHVSPLFVDCCMKPFCICCVVVAALSFVDCSEAYKRGSNHHHCHRLVSLLPDSCR